ncbi:MAG: glycosyl hydrolase family 28-related protein, partial [Pseudomonadota bacterium]
GFWNLAGRTVTARQAGAVGNGVTDDTAALRRAFNSGRNVFIESGTYYITNSLSTAVQSQRIIGDGRGKTRIKVDQAFSMGSSGVIRVIDHYVTIQDIEIDFDQGSASTRGALVEYPPAIDIPGFFRARLTALRFRKAYDGVRAIGNCGGAIFEDIECGSLNVGFRLGGSLDTVELRNCRIWPYEFAGDAGLMSVYNDGNNIGFRIGRVDDLKMTNCTPFRAKLIFEASDGFKPFGTVNGLALDGSQSSIEMSDGEISISGIYATTEDANDTMIRQTGGLLSMSDFSFKVGVNSNAPVLDVDGPNAVCLIQNGRVLLGSNPTVEGLRVREGKLTASSVRFAVSSTATRTGACIRASGGELVAFGNTVNKKSSGSGPFIRVQNDGQHAIFGNASNGWDLDFPANRTNGTYGPNHDGSAVVMDSILAVGPNNTSSEGGELRLDGAGSNNDVKFDNFQGNARVFGLGSGKALQVVSPQGTATLFGNSLRFSNGIVIDRGASNEIETTAFGEQSLRAVTTGAKNTAVGNRALSAVEGGGLNTALGFRAGLAVVGGDQNTFVGANTGLGVTENTGVTLLGANAGAALTLGGNNTGVGRHAFDGVAGTTLNSAAFGAYATVTGSNQVQLGDSATTTYTYGAVQNRSDARDKADVRDTVLGLDFVKALRPVDFRWDYREDYRQPADAAEDPRWQAPTAGSKKRSRFHHGFVAQEVHAVIEQTGVDFGGYQDHALAGGADVKSIGYDEMIAPLVKAVQELANRIERMETARDTETDAET